MSAAGGEFKDGRWRDSFGGSTCEPFFAAMMLWSLSNPHPQTVVLPITRQNARQPVVPCGSAAIEPRTQPLAEI
jgi:hypothetical protein